MAAEIMTMAVDASALRARVDDLEAKLSAAERRILIMTGGAPGSAIDVPGKGLVEAPANMRAIFGVLLARKNHAVTRASLFEAMYGGEPDRSRPDLKIIDVYVCRLRRMLNGSTVRISNVWGIGYRLVDADNLVVPSWVPDSLRALYHEMARAAGEEDAAAFVRALKNKRAK